MTVEKKIDIEGPAPTKTESWVRCNREKKRMGQQVQWSLLHNDDCQLTGLQKTYHSLTKDIFSSFSYCKKTSSDSLTRET